MNLKQDIYSQLLDPQKSVMDLLQAFEILLRKEENVTLHFYGKGIHEDKARIFQKSKGLQSRFF